MTISCRILNKRTQFGPNAGDNQASESEDKYEIVTGKGKLCPCRTNRGRPLRASPDWPPTKRERSVEQIVAHDLLQDVVAVQTADHGAGVVVVGNVGRVLGKEIAHDLIDGVITLLGQRGVDGRQNPLHFLVSVPRVGHTVQRDDVQPVLRFLRVTDIIQAAVRRNMNIARFKVRHRRAFSSFILS